MYSEWCKYITSKIQFESCNFFYYKKANDEKEYQLSAVRAIQPAQCSREIITDSVISAVLNCGYGLKLNFYASCLALFLGIFNKLWIINFYTILKF